MERTILEKPFESKLIKTRPGKFGEEISYVGAGHYIRRLNEAAEGDWSFEIIDWKELADEVMVLGILKMDGCSKMAFGGSAITLNKSTKARISVADDFKAAATDALKKACSLFGLGLHMYESESTSEKKSKAKTASEKVNGISGRTADVGGSLTGSAKATLRQKKALISIANNLGVDEQKLDNWVSEEFSTPLAELSRRNASELIQAFNETQTFPPF